MVSILSSIFVGFAVFFIALGLSMSFEDKIPLAVIRMVILSVVTGLSCYYETIVSPIFAMLLLTAMLIIMVFMVVWWMCDGSTIKELIFFILLDLLYLLVAQGAAVRIIDLTESQIIIGLVRVLPVVVFIISIGIFIADMIWFRKDLESEDFDPSDYIEVGGEER